MKSFDRSIAQLYKKRNDEFTYFFVDGETKIVAGENDVTEEWIEKLKMMHRKERNDIRRDDLNYSLELLTSEYGDKSWMLHDQNVTIEETYMNKASEEECRNRLNAALKTLTNEQFKLLYDVRARGITISSLARSKNVHESSLRERISRIEKRLRKILSSPPNP